jgi:hypothetical protein
LTGGRVAGYTKPDPPIEVGVTEYEYCSDRVAVNVRCVETDALSIGIAGFAGMAGMARFDSIESPMSRAGLPQ